MSLLSEDSRLSVVISDSDALCISLKFCDCEWTTIPTLRKVIGNRGLKSDTVLDLIM